VTSDGAVKLTHALKTLRIRWEEARDQWSDAVRRNFEEHHLGPLDERTEVAIRGMQELAEVLDQMRRECSDDAEWRR
jgi:hypothetical protein